MEKKLFFILPLILAILAGCAGPTPEPTPEPKEIWHLVVIGDSNLRTLDYAYQKEIEEDLGVEVERGDYTVSGLSAASVLEALTSEDPSLPELATLPEALKEAEVVVMWVGPHESIDPQNPFESTTCVSAEGGPPPSCEPDTLVKFTEDLKAIWAEIFRLRAGQPTVMRATGMYFSNFIRWDSLGLTEECISCFENVSEAARQAAEAFGIPFLDRMALYNGPDHRESAVAKGLIGPDGAHPSAEGTFLTAKALAEMGYEPVPPP